MFLPGRFLLMFMSLILLLSSGCNKDAAGYSQGYLEGDYLLIAPLQSGRIEQVMVTDGERVKAGAVLARLEQAHATLAVAQAQARYEQTSAMLLDLEKGARSAELHAMQAQVAEQQASLLQARTDVKRLQPLAAKQYVSAQQLEQARTLVKRLEATVARQQSALKLLQQGSRVDRVAAARAEQHAAQAALHDARRLLEETVIHAPVAGLVERLILGQGELAGPAAPLLRFLPDGAVKLLFFVPEADRASYHIGDMVNFYCDGCGGGHSARISRIASEAEYTPPVLFNRDNRYKLLFRLEAKPDDSSGLMPGLPVEVH